MSSPGCSFSQLTVTPRKGAMSHLKVAAMAASSLWHGSFSTSVRPGILLICLFPSVLLLPLPVASFVLLLPLLCLNLSFTYCLSNLSHYPLKRLPPAIPPINISLFHFKKQKKGGFHSLVTTMSTFMKVPCLLHFTLPLHIPILTFRQCLCSCLINTQTATFRQKPACVNST